MSFNFEDAIRRGQAVLIPLGGDDAGCAMIYLDERTPAYCGRCERPRLIFRASPAETICIDCWRPS